MPNPIAHPAAAIPFAKAGLVFSALVVGSLSPDAGYLVPVPIPFFMYTVQGLILFDVPAGLLMLWVFHLLLKWPLLSLLPRSLQRRLFRHAQGFAFGPPKRFALILLSLLVGSLTHLIWDSFTHDYGWMVEHVPLLRTAVAGIPLYTLLQHLGTLVGILLLATWFVRWLPQAPQGDQLPKRFSGRVQLIFLALMGASLASVEAGILYLRFVRGSPFAGGHFLLFGTLFSAVLIVSAFVGLYCLAWTLRFHRSIHPQAFSPDP